VVIVLLTPGVSLADLQNEEDAPALARLAARSPLGVMPTRAPGRDPDPLRDACLMLGRGDRGAAPAPEDDTLFAALKRAGVLAAVIADDGGAAGALLGLPPPVPFTYVTPDWRVSVPVLPDGIATDPEGFAGALLVAAHRAAARPGKTLIIADFDDLYRVDRYAPLALPRATATHRREGLRRLNRAVAALTASDGLPGGRMQLTLVTPVGEADAATNGERLGPVLIADAADTRNGLLSSASTRGRAGLVAATDIAATVAAQLGLPSDRYRIGAGRPAYRVRVPGEGATSGAYLAGRVAGWAAQARAQRALIYVPWILGALLAIAALLVSEPSATARIGAAALGIGVALYPLALLLTANLLTIGAIPPLLYGTAALPCLLLTAGLCAPAGRRHSHAALLTVAVLTAATYLADTALGGPLHARGAPLSYAVTEAARFYGLGNEAGGLLIGAALLACLAAGSGPRSALLIGAAVALTLGHPALGTNAGAFIGALAGFGALAGVCLAGRKTGTPHRGRTVALSVGLILLIGAVVMAYAVWDGARSADSRSHVGEAVAQARARGIGALTAVIERKASMNARLLVSSPWAVLLAAEAVLFVVLWHRRRADLPPAERAVLTALAVGGLVLLVFNDSGVVATATCLLWAIPLLLLPLPKGP
jgi:hypothetical protein